MFLIGNNCTVLPKITETINRLTLTKNRFLHLLINKIRKPMFCEMLKNGQNNHGKPVKIKNLRSLEKSENKTRGIIILFKTCFRLIFHLGDQTLLTSLSKLTLW